MRKLTIERIRKMFPSDLVSIKYEGCKEKLFWRCLINEEHGCYQQNIHKHLFGQRCPKCWHGRRGKSKRLKIENIEKQFPELLPGQTYINNTKKLLWRCLENLSHGTYLQSHNSHQQKHGCALCARDRAYRATRLTVEDVKKNFPLDFIDGQKYVNAVQKLRWLCLVHGEYLQSYNARQQGSGCPECHEIRRGDSIRFTVTRIQRQFPGEVVAKQRYVNSQTPIWWKCLVNTSHPNYLQTYSNHSAGKKCPLCCESRAERKIAEYLNKASIGFEREKSFPTCRDKKSLIFDFVLKSKKTLIEFQGKQHYASIDWFGGINALKSLQKRDRIKVNWAARNGWRLIRIPYTVRNIEAYLDKRLLLAKAA